MSQKIIILICLLAFMSNTSAEIPPSPIELSNTTGNYWVDYSWSDEFVNELYCIAGETGGYLNGYHWSGSTWTGDSSASGMVDVGTYSAPSVFTINKERFSIIGKADGNYDGYKWNGATWINNATIKSGLFDKGSKSTPTVFYKDSVWYLIQGESNSGNFFGYNWTGSTWQEDTQITSGLSSVGTYSAPSVFNMGGTWYLIAGEYDGGFNGFRIVGSSWQSYPAIIDGLGDIGTISKPTVFELNDAWYCVAGENDGKFDGWNWTGSTWASNATIMGGLGDVGGGSCPTTFFIAKNVTDGYNVRFNMVWNNNTQKNYWNQSLTECATGEITVYAMNNTGNDNLSASFLHDTVTMFCPVYPPTANELLTVKAIAALTAGNLFVILIIAIALLTMLFTLSSEMTLPKNFGVNTIIGLVITVAVIYIGIKIIDCMSVVAG